MAADKIGNSGGWRRFQKLKFDKQAASKRLKRAEKSSLRHAHKFLVKRWRNVRQVRQTVVLWLIAVALLVGASGLQLAWDRQSYQTVAGASGGTFVEALEGNVETLNPLYAETPASQAVAHLLFSRLLSYDRSGHLTYDLAKSISVSEDRLKYVLTMRSDAIWHDGEPMTADDVLFTIDLIKDEQTRIPIKGWDGVSVTKVDQNTIVFKLRSVYTPFLSALTFPIVPKHILNEVPRDKMREAEFSSQPIGSGPFVFRTKQNATDENVKVVHMAANNYYYGSTPRLARMQVMAVPDDAAMKKVIAMNEVTSAVGVPHEVTSKVSEERYSVSHHVRQAGVYAFLNNSSTILHDKEVRQALQLATNTEEIRRNIGSDVAPLALPYTKFQMPNKGVPDAPEFDVKKAARLLDKAGWKVVDGVRQKDGQSLRLSVVTTVNMDYERALETLIGQWRQLGVLVNERVIDAADPTQGFEQSVLQPRDYDVLIYQLTFPDQDMYPYWHSSEKLNLSNYSSASADDILSSARSVTNKRLLDAKHVSFARQWLADAPAIGLYQPVMYTVTAKSAHVVMPDQTIVAIGQRYADVAQWTVRQRDVYKTP